MGEQRYYPSEICAECGIKYGRPRGHVVGMWSGKCEWCGKEGPVCAPRDYLYPDWSGTPPDEAVNCCKKGTQ